MDAQAHKLKGSAAALCAESVRAAAEALENACRDDQTETETLKDLTANLATALEALLAA
ncbi:Hpt domain-containing protein [Candidatus Thiosymbion oneisti]|uniref:Hpt domain-containing protein n=1 Tax=Candidatus Thiosymbion oneisti TaxID=589554 RepID=UPI001A9C4473